MFLLRFWVILIPTGAGLNQPIYSYHVNRPMIGVVYKSNWKFFQNNCRITGFYFVEVKGKLATREEAPVLVVAPHSTYFDGFAVFWADLPYIISRQENRGIPFIGK